MKFEMEIDTHSRHCKILDRMYRRLSEPTSEEAQVDKEILDEKKQQIHRLQQKLAEPVFKQTEENMELQRTESAISSTLPTCDSCFKGVSLSVNIHTLVSILCGSGFCCSRFHIMWQRIHGSRSMAAAHN